MNAAIYPDSDRLQALLLPEPVVTPRSKDYWPGVALAVAAVFLVAGFSMGWL